MMPAPDVVHRYAATPAGDLHYVEAGAGTPVLLIHGGHGSWIHWLANIDALARHRRVLALDLPGFGHSHDPGRLLSLDEYAAIVSAFMRTLELREVALAGFSFGTLVAATVACNEPERVVSLTLVNPPGIGERTPQAQALPARLSALAREQGLRAGVAGSLRELMLRDQGRIDEALIDLVSDCVTRTRYVTRNLSRQSQMIPILAQVRQKTMVLLGANDPYHCHELQGRSHRINQALKADAVRIVDHAAHWAQYDQPEAVNRMLLEFIEPAHAVGRCAMPVTAAP